MSLFYSIFITSMIPLRTVSPAYLHNHSNDKEKIGELYETLANWDTTHMSIEVFLLLLTKDHYDLTIRQWALQNIDAKASGHFDKITYTVEGPFCTIFCRDPFIHGFACP